MCRQQGVGNIIRIILGVVHSYPDHAGISDMAVELEEMTKLHGMPPPFVAADSPREGELEAATVE